MAEQLSAGDIAQKIEQQVAPQPSVDSDPYVHTKHSELTRQIGEALHQGKATLGDLYRSHKHTPHSPPSLFLKYLVHRVNNLDKYGELADDLKDRAFLDLHQQGKAAEKNGHVEPHHLHTWLRKNPKLVSALVNHRNRLHAAILRGCGPKTRKINGEWHVALTRGLNSEFMGPEFTLASFSDKQDSGFGTRMHHAWVPLKDLWYSYAMGPKYPAGEHGHENEYLVSHTGTRFKANPEDVRENRFNSMHGDEWQGEPWPMLGKAQVHFTEDGTPGIAHIPWMHLHNHLFDDSTDAEIAESLRNKFVRSRWRPFISPEVPNSGLYVGPNAGPETRHVLDKHNLLEHFVDSPLVRADELVRFMGARPSTIAKIGKNPNLTPEAISKIVQAYKDGYGNGPHYMNLMVHGLVGNPNMAPHNYRELWDAIKDDATKAATKKEGLQTNDHAYLNMTQSLAASPNTPPQLLAELARWVPYEDPKLNSSDRGSFRSVLYNLIGNPGLTDDNRQVIWDGLKKSRLDSRAWERVIERFPHLPKDAFNELMDADRQVETDEDSSGPYRPPVKGGKLGKQQAHDFMAGYLKHAQYLDDHEVSRALAKDDRDFFLALSMRVGNPGVQLSKESVQKIAEYVDDAIANRTDRGERFDEMIEHLSGRPELSRALLNRMGKLALRKDAQGMPFLRAPEKILHSLAFNPAMSVDSFADFLAHEWQLDPVDVKNQAMHLGNPDIREKDMPWIRWAAYNELGHRMRRDGKMPSQEERQHLVRPLDEAVTLDKAEKVILTVPLDMIDPDPINQQVAQDNIRRGHGSMTDGPMGVYFNRDTKRYDLADGHHRYEEKKMRGEKHGLIEVKGTLDPLKNLRKAPSPTNEDVAARMYPHTPHLHEGMQRVETYNLPDTLDMSVYKGINPHLYSLHGKPLYHHVYHKWDTNTGYRSYLHALSLSPDPFDDVQIIGSSAMGTRPAASFWGDDWDKSRAANIPWKDGEVPMAGETAFQPVFARKGAGTTLYRRMLQYHGRLASDSSTSAAADNLWNRVLRTPDVRGQLGPGKGNVHWAEWHGAPNPQQSAVMEMNGKSYAQMKKKEPNLLPFGVDHNLNIDSPVMDVAVGMTGFDQHARKLFRAARFLVGGGELPLDKIRRAIYNSNDDLEAAALMAYGMKVDDKNRRALRNVQSLDSFQKAEPAVQGVPTIEAPVLDGKDTAEELQRAFEYGSVQKVNLNGKHSKGSMVAKDPKTGHTYLLKPGSGDQSPAAGAKEERASQSQREAAFWHVADVWGLGDEMPRADLIIVNGEAVAAMRLLPVSFKNLGVAKIHEPHLVPAVLEPYRQSGDLHKWAIIDYVLGNTDRHSQNLMISKDDTRIALIDHGSAFAGKSFDPAHDPNTFIPYYLRAYTSRKFTEMSAAERYNAMPKVSAQIEKMVEDWLNGLEPGKLEIILKKYGIGPEPCLVRLARLKMMPGSKVEAIDKLWAGLE